MNEPTSHQIVSDNHGKPVAVVVPYEEYQALVLRGAEGIPHGVVRRIALDGASAMRAWREHLGLTQQQLAERLGMTQAAYSQIETGSHPRASTRNRVANALGIRHEQLDI